MITLWCFTSQADVITSASSSSAIISFPEEDPLFESGIHKLINEEISGTFRTRIVQVSSGDKYILRDNMHFSFELDDNNSLFNENVSSKDRNINDYISNSSMIIFYASASESERNSVLQKYSATIDSQNGSQYFVTFPDNEYSVINEFGSEPFVAFIQAYNDRAQIPWWNPSAFPALSPFWRNRNIVDGWRETRIGLINDNRYPWVYHVDKGWLYFFTGKESPYEYATDTTYYWSQADGWTKLD